MHSRSHIGAILFGQSLTQPVQILEYDVIRLKDRTLAQNPAKYGTSIRSRLTEKTEKYSKQNEAKRELGQARRGILHKHMEYFIECSSLAQKLFQKRRREGPFIKLPCSI